MDDEEEELNKLVILLGNERIIRINTESKRMRKSKICIEYIYLTYIWAYYQSIINICILMRELITREYDLENESILREW